MSENDNRKLSGFFKKMFRVGTPECAVFSAVLAMVLAVLILCVGLWKTLLVALFVALGIFIGGVPDKKNKLKALINRIFPPRNAEPYDREAFMKELNRELKMPAAAEEEKAENEQDNTVQTEE